MHKSIGCVLNYLLGINKDLKVGAAMKAGNSRQLTPAGLCSASLLLHVHNRPRINWSAQSEQQFCVQVTCLVWRSINKEKLGKLL